MKGDIAMSAQVQQTAKTSAQIIPFPIGGRRSMTEKRNETGTEARLPAVSFGGAWYHDAAIQESKRGREC
jgi:hypothetical protein